MTTRDEKIQFTKFILPDKLREIQGAIWNGQNIKAHEDINALLIQLYKHYPYKYGSEMGKTYSDERVYGYRSES